MALGHYQLTIVDNQGNVVPNANVVVRRETSGTPLAALKADREGTVGKSNPGQADADGYFDFFVIGGAYSIWAYLGAPEAPTWQSKKWRYVPVGLNAESDEALAAVASTEDAGIIELATPEEVAAGEDDERAVTPAGAAAAYASKLIPDRDVAGTTDTLLLSDSGKLITTSSASAVAITVPPESSVPWVKGMSIPFIQEGAGKLSFVGGAGVDIRSAGGYKSIAAQYGQALLVYRGSDVWDLTGLLAS
jgi:hypothetical protein